MKCCRCPAWLSWLPRKCGYTSAKDKSSNESIYNKCWIFAWIPYKGKWISITTPRWCRKDWRTRGSHRMASCGHVSSETNFGGTGESKRKIIGVERELSMLGDICTQGNEKEWLTHEVYGTVPILWERLLAVFVVRSRLLAPMVTNLKRIRQNKKR